MLKIFFSFILIYNVSAQEIPILFWNTQNLISKKDVRIQKLEKFFPFLGNYETAIIFFAEFKGDLLSEEILTKMNFDFSIVSDGLDRRGVGITAFFKNKNGAIQEIEKREIFYKRGHFRSIFELSILFKKKGKINFLINHWPSRLNPLAFRKENYELILERLKRDSGTNIIMGDFNNEIFFLKKFFEIVPHEQRKTYFYFPEVRWFNFDRLFVSEDLTFLRAEVFKNQWLSRTFQLDNSVESLPISNGKKNLGASDHLPLLLFLKI